MNLRDIIKKLWFSLTGKPRIVLLDYPVIPERIYKEETRSPHKVLFEMINAEQDEYKSILTRSLKYTTAILFIGNEKHTGNDIDPVWNNGYFSGLDIIMLYTLLAEIKPRKYLEIGSGTSTRVAYKAKKDNDLSFSITSIDPSPRKEVTNIADHVMSEELQKIPLEYFHSLEEGDVLFFDGTHTLYPNSDVMWFFLEVLPILKKGVYVHLHDIYLPYDYPEFMCKRYYNEQYILAACLMDNPKRYKIICPNHFIATEKKLHDILEPFWKHEIFRTTEKNGGSFWFRIQTLPSFTTAAES